MREREKSQVIEMHSVSGGKNKYGQADERGRARGLGAR